MKKYIYCKELNTFKNINFIYIIGFTLCFIFIIYKCRFGFGNIDESFYLTIPLRLCQGDGLFVDEIHLSQMSSVFIYPLMRLYLFLFDSTEGIILTFRYIFCILHASTAIFLYLKLKKISSCSAIFISLLYLIFTPFGIMALSYNSMGLAFMSIAAVLIYTEDDKISTFYFAGLFLAAAVLCCPTLVILYLYYLILFIIQSKKEGRNNFSGSTSIKSFIFLSLGCVTLASVFFAFVLSRASISEILNAFPFIFTDPEHSSKSLFELIFNFAKGVIYPPLNRGAAILFILSSVILSLFIFCKKTPKRKKIFLIVGLVLTLLYICSLLSAFPHLHFLIFPFVILGAYPFVVLPKDNLKEFLCLYLPGIIYSFCISIISNNVSSYVISTASFVSLIGSIIMFFRSAKNIYSQASYKTYFTYKCFVILFLLFVLFSVMTVRYNSLFWENGTMAQMTEKITVGANKGIYTTPESKESYTLNYYEVAPVRDFEGDSVLYFSKKTWLYLEDKKKNASFSAWLSGINELSSDKLVKYYGLDNSRMPDIVYCDIGDYNSEYSIFKYLKENGYKIQKNENSYIYIK